MAKQKWEEMEEEKREAQSCIQALFISLIKLDTIKTRPGCCFCCDKARFLFRNQTERYLSHSYRATEN